MFLNVINEFLSVVGSCWRCKDYASDAFFQCRSKSIDDRLVKVVQGFWVVSCSVNMERVFRLDNVAEDLP